MKIVLVYRPELVDTDGDHKPFEGIEILGVANTDDEANELIQNVLDEHIVEPPTTPWQFHIDSV
jgi:hypothetical protein